MGNICRSNRHNVHSEKLKNTELDDALNLLEKRAHPSSSTKLSSDSDQHKEVKLGEDGQIISNDDDSDPADSDAVASVVASSLSSSKSSSESSEEEDEESSSNVSSVSSDGDSSISSTVIADP